MQASCDASIIIDLPKDEKLIFLAKKRYSKVFVPTVVLQEHKKPQKHLQIIKELLKEGFLERHELNNEGLKFYRSLLKRKTLGRGECAAIAISLQLDLREVLLDDKLATATASKLGLKPVSISYLPLWGFKQRLIKKEDAETIFRKLYHRDDSNLLIMLGILGQM